uniref:DDE_Tnp_1_7 domain-containing protein n=1 Tax=Trichobilharzia regenti TaxID=157069 RepID=A0AA85KBG2_TRIRE|nr:unnamed protein product [Trichobilharzia regenti]
MSTTCSTEDDNLECESTVYTVNHMRMGEESLFSNDEFMPKVQAPNADNSYNNMKRPGLTPSMTAYRWIVSQPTLSKDIFSQIKDKTTTQWLSVDTTDDWLMHIPKCSMTVDKISLKNWQNYCLHKPYSSNEDQFTTSYSINYQLKHLDEPTKLRPTSANRRHKPQSSSLFLNCHLHKLPKYEAK